MNWTDVLSGCLLYSVARSIATWWPSTWAWFTASTTPRRADLEDSFLVEDLFTPAWWDSFHLILVCWNAVFSTVSLVLYCFVVGMRKIMVLYVYSWLTCTFSRRRRMVLMKPCSSPPPPWIPWCLNTSTEDWPSCSRPCSRCDWTLRLCFLPPRPHWKWLPCQKWKLWDKKDLDFLAFNNITQTAGNICPRSLTAPCILLSLLPPLPSRSSCIASSWLLRCVSAWDGMVDFIVHLCVTKYLKNNNLFQKRKEVSKIK